MAVTALAVVALAATEASAADLGGALPEEEPPLEPAAVELMRDWSGFYFGGAIGFAHGVWTIDFGRAGHGHAEEGLDGLAGSLFAGYSLQLQNRLVVGIEAQIGTTDASQSNKVFDNDDTSAEYGNFGAVRGRVGYAIDRLLVYAAAGWAFLDIDESIQKGQNAGEQLVFEGQTEDGYTVGLGAEYRFSDHWIGRLDYQYADFGAVTLVNADGDRADFQNELHLVQAGLAYKF